MHILDMLTLTMLLLDILTPVIYMLPPAPCYDMTYHLTSA